MRYPTKALRISGKREAAGWLAWETTDIGTTQLVASVATYSESIDRAKRNDQKLEIDAVAWESWVAEGSAPKTPPANVTIVWPR